MSDHAATVGGRRGLSRGELALLGLLAGLLALINGLSAMVAGAAAWLSWLRHRHMADASAIYQSAAFLIFSVTAAVQTLAEVDVIEVALGLSLDRPSQAPLYAWAYLRLLAGALLVVAAWLRLNPAASHRYSGRQVITLTLLLVVGGCAALYALEPILPPLLGAEALVRLQAPAVLPGPLPGITLLEVVLQSVAVVLLLTAAFGYALAARRGQGAGGMYLAAGLVIAAVAQVHFALFAGIYSGVVSTGDLMRIFFYGFVVFGIQAEAGATLRELRAANRQLHELRGVELANASLAERARLAREVHDGLAQHLWLAKLSTERLAGNLQPAELAAVREELNNLLEAGLDEARRTVSALRDASAPSRPFRDALTRHIRRFEESTGLTVRFSADPPPVAGIPPRTSAELLRIAQEALNNVRKHADATVVTIEVTQTSDRLEMTIRDNGVGFDPAADHLGYGLEGMRERAEAVGGRLTVESGELSGTLVRVELPTGPSQVPPGAPPT
jgi:signal transduction histidine kinase